jgi:ADP-ribose pyrophosphatase YjhB (NUDIX family)
MSRTIRERKPFSAIMSSIRPISICLLRKGNRILVNRTFDSIKKDYYWRPLGGGIEFGEHSRDAIVREIREETSNELTNVHLLEIIENTFQLDGSAHHEIVFVYDAEFVNQSLYEQDEVQCYEQRTFIAYWKTMEEINQLGDRLVPDGLSTLIASLS